MLILASTSPYRRELLERLGIPFLIEAPGVEEIPLAGETPRATAERLAHAKAHAVAARHPDALVIGSDQTATLDGKTTIGKPGNAARAEAQLRAASGNTTTFHTGLALIRRTDGFERIHTVDTQVRMRVLTDAQIARYIAREPAFDVAGAAKVEGLGIALISEVQGPDPTALVGLPLIALVSALEAAGYRLP